MNKEIIEGFSPQTTNRFTHVIDWCKVKNTDDIIEILKSLEMSVDPNDCNKKLLRFITPKKQ